MAKAFPVGPVAEPPLSLRARVAALTFSANAGAVASARGANMTKIEKPMSRPDGRPANGGQVETNGGRVHPVPGGRPGEPRPTKK